MRDSRPSASQRLYDSRWDKARKTYLEHHPLCVACRNHGRNTKATVVDHIKPHNRNPELFWNQATGPDFVPAVTLINAPSRQQVRSNTQAARSNGAAQLTAHPSTQPI
jgi:hypothetical protein